MKDAKGVESSVMHACGHDLHMTVWLGTLKTMVSLRNEWKGTLMAIAQPAEEGYGGAASMIKDGLFKKFPIPNAAFCFHVSAELPAGTIGYFPGAIFAGVNSVDMTVYGIGGHGAMPHKTIDPIVLSARIILDLQTIVSREINPVQPAVVTVGSIHGGTKHNIIPDEVKMQLTIRFFDDNVYKQIQEALVRISRGIAISAGLPENLMPVVKVQEECIPPVNNDPDLVMKSVTSIETILGKDKVRKVDPATVAEDFSRYGRTDEKIPIALFWLGGINKDQYADHLKNGTLIPSLHNSSFRPDFIPAYQCGVSCMSRILIDDFNKQR
jgi:amidohydrolase